MGIRKHLTEYVRTDKLEKDAVRARKYLETHSAVSKYPELDKLADKIARDVAERINREAPKIKSEMPYRQQYVLEEVINILKDWV